MPARRTSGHPLTTTFAVCDLIGHFTLGPVHFWQAGLAGDSERGQELVATMPAKFSDVLGDDPSLGGTSTGLMLAASVESAVDGVSAVNENVSLRLW